MLGVKPVVLISFDFKTGSSQCCIVQLLAVIVHADGSGERKEYDSYVKPCPTAKWLPQTVQVHGLHHEHPNVKTACPIEVVWPEFVEFIECNVKEP